MDKDQKEIRFSTTNIFSKISEILKKNGIEESPLEAMIDEKASFINIVFSLTEDLIKEKMSEKDFISSLKKDLKIITKTAENILEDIKKDLLPFAEKVNVEQQKTKNKTMPEETVTARPPRLIDKKESINPIEDIGEPPKTFSKKPDSYREPIE